MRATTPSAGTEHGRPATTALRSRTPAATRGRTTVRTTASALALAALLGAAGLTHLRVPALYEPLVPARLGPPRPWVVGSGWAELACAAAVALPRTRRTGAQATAALLVAVLPGNIQMALDSRPGAPSWTRRPAVAWARLPLQVPLIAWARGVARAAARP